MSGISKRKVIVFGINHTNTLGLVRSLGEAGHPITVLLEPCDLKFCCLRFSKYIKKLYHLKDRSEGVRILKDLCGSESEKPIVFSGSDSSMSLIDAHYAELKDFVEVFNAKGEQGRINEINLRNDGVNHLYTDAGINMPGLWVRYKAGESIDLGGINLGLKLPRYLMQESDLANIRTGKVGVYAWLRDFCRAKSHFVFDMRDPLPYLYTVYIHFRQAGQKLIRKVAG